MDNIPLQEEVDQPHTGKCLALFFDGTWDTPAHNTNVWRQRLMLAHQGWNGLPQESFYDEGVGTHWYDKITGGAFGVGLSENIRKAYRWLMERYNVGDEIFIFGFSRGAFTARSLAGLIARCGLLRPDAPMSFTQIFERYQRGDAAKPIYELIRNKQHQEDFNFEDKILLRHSYYRRNLIKMIGVWDTVGSIGVPFGKIKGISSHTLKFHNTRLSNTIQHSYHALALDERRQPYWAVLWTKFTPEHSDATKQSAKNDCMVEQRWFSGAHANIGGGYRSDLMPERPLAWIQEKASYCGLVFRSTIHLTDEDLQMLPTDSYSEFLYGVWKRIPFGKWFRPYIRWVMADPIKKDARSIRGGEIKPGWVEAVNERIDMSVFRRCQLHKNYRPASLCEWAKRKGLDLEAIIANPEGFPELWQPVQLCE